MKRIAIINGVNLGMLGTREVDIYGSVDFDTYFKQLCQRFPELELTYFQTNCTDELVNCILKNRDLDGIILNPGAYTHTEIVLADTVKSISAKVIEVHISNLFNRENYRKKSYLATVCSGSIVGFGLKGYDLALFSFFI